MVYKKPLPEINADTKPFWDGCIEHQLRFQKCQICNHVRWPASILCPRCYSSDTDWVIASGKGKVYTFVVFRYAYHKAFKNDLPYVTAVVELEEGPHLLTNIVDCGPEEVYCDMPVEVKWEAINKKLSLPKFKPVI